MRRKTPRCKACGKKAYPSVEAVIHAINGRIRVGAAPLRFYKCPISGYRYHMTKKLKHEQ